MGIAVALGDMGAGVGAEAAQAERDRTSVITNRLKLSCESLVYTTIQEDYRNVGLSPVYAANDKIRFNIKAKSGHPR